MRTTLPLLLLFALAPSVVLAAQLRSFADLASFVVSILNSGTALLVLAGVVVYFLGMSTNLMKMKKGDPTALKSYALWGIAVIFMMVSIWGVVRLVQETIFGASGGSSSSGSSGGSTQSPFQAPQFTE